MALPENLVIASAQSEVDIPAAANPISVKAGELAVAAVVPIAQEPLNQPPKKVHDPHQMSRFRAKQANRRLLF